MTRELKKVLMSDVQWLLTPFRWLTNIWPRKVSVPTIEEAPYNRLSFGSLNNIETGEYHVILFTDAPRPSDYHKPHTSVRIKSLGHSGGFKTYEEMRSGIQDMNCRWVGDFSWDGTYTPAMILDRAITEHEAKAIFGEVESEHV